MWREAHAIYDHGGRLRRCAVTGCDRLLAHPQARCCSWGCKQRAYREGVVLEPDDELVSLPIQWDLPGRTRPLVDWFTKWEYEKYLADKLRPEEIADD